MGEYPNPPGNPHWRKGIGGNPAGRPKGSKNRGFLSKAYIKVLGLPATEHLKEHYGLDDGDTVADAIATNVVGRALGFVKDDQICFIAIKELREATEGKIPEKAIVAGGNEELANLAAIMAGNPAKPDGEEEQEGGDQASDGDDSVTDITEENFHG
jgi:hypothetical protein